MISDTAKAIASAMPDAFATELAKYSGPFSTPTDQDIEHAANEVIVSNLAAISQAHDVQQGRTVDVSKIPPAYLGLLNKLNVNEAQVREVATRVYPHLSPEKALAKWQAKAASVKIGDLSHGYETTESAD